MDPFGCFFFWLILNSYFIIYFRRVFTWSIKRTQWPFIADVGCLTLVNMERQQLLKANDRGVIFNGDDVHQNQTSKRTSVEVSRSSDDQRVREARRLNQYEARGGFLSTVFSDFFSAKKSNRNAHSFVCDIVLVCFLVFNCCLFLDLCMPMVEATPVISEKHLSTYHCELN